MSQALKSIAREAIDALQEVLPRIARGVSSQSKRSQLKIKAMAQAIRDKDLELARGVRRTDVENPTTIDVSVRGFRNRRYDPEEFDAQVREQIAALQDMSLLEWIGNRGRYLEGGRTSASRAAQQNARDIAEEAHLEELLDAGVEFDDAVRQTDEWLASQAALHRLDGIAGGNVTDIWRLGDSGVNSSLGSQWRSRVRALDAAVTDFVESNPDVDLSQVFMNVSFR